MTTTSPDNIFSPDASSIFALTTDLAAMAASTQSALIKRSWYYLGTDAQRLALAGAELRNGIIFEDISTGEMWQYKGGAWVSKDLVRNLGRITPITAGNQGGITTTRTKVTGTGIAITLSAPTILRFLGGFVTYSSNTSDVVLAEIVDGSSTIFSTTNPANSSTTVVATGRIQLLSTEILIPAGAHSFYLAASRVVGPGNVTVSPGASSPTYFSIDRVG